jgi:adenine-specific DNA-methyltransferase
MSFDVDTVSLHVHERIDPLTIIENAKKKEETAQLQLFHYFESSGSNLPIREAIEFYKHSQNWSNRLIGENLEINDENYNNPNVMQIRE